MKDAQIARLEKAAESVGHLSNRLFDATEKVQSLWKDIRAAIALTRQLTTPLARPAHVLLEAQSPKPEPRSRRSGPTAAASDAKFGKCERALLIAAVQRLPKASTRPQLSLLSGYSIKSSSFSNGLSALRSNGYMEGGGDHNRPTDAGVAALGAYDPLPTGAELIAYWARTLGKAERALFDVFVQHYPHEVSKDRLSEESGYSVTSSSFSNALSKLRTLELVRSMRASEELFE